MYDDFMLEYENMGHMSRSQLSSEEVSYYLPHHRVLNENSSTTKLRVVFNGSEKTDTGLSVNDLQYSGPNLQDDLWDILIRFRKHNVVICADITKMYRMILIDPSQRSLQRILWRSDPTQEMGEFNLHTVTYGTKSAPYLAIRCVKQLGLESMETFPAASRTILKDFYVNDLLSGTDNAESAIQLGVEVDAILKTGCMELRKWILNDPSVVENIGNLDANLSNIHFGEKDQHKTLGLYWSFKVDELMFSININIGLAKNTKRTILSDISRIFDPLGLLGPCIIIAKILLQRLWCEKLTWDETLPMELDTSWRKLRSQFPVLNGLKINRQAICKEYTSLEIHGFSDASIHAYGACVYLKSISVDNEVNVLLLCSKVRVAPLKSLTIPRLELCGALLLAQLVYKVKDCIELSFSNTFLWSDSTVVLSWIQMSPHILQTFVGNRVNQIQELTEPSSWRYVKSEENPADVLSRGLSPGKILNCVKWWSGPEFLLLEESLWDTSESFGNTSIPEMKNQDKLCNVVLLESEKKIG